MRSAPLHSETPTVSSRGAFARSRSFLEGLGLVVGVGDIAAPFLAGVEIVDGGLRVEHEDDDLAGELLHEAGHLAVIPAAFRPYACGDLGGVSKAMSHWINTDGPLLDPDHPTVRGILQAGECEAIAWSFAAAAAIGIDTRLPFVRGFEGDGLALHDQVASGYYFGVHGLAAAGMTDLPRRHCVTPFPTMKRWLQV